MQEENERNSVLQEKMSGGQWQQPNIHLASNWWGVCLDAHLHPGEHYEFGEDGDVHMEAPSRAASNVYFLIIDYFLN